jgi:predicted small secreted protein
MHSLNAASARLIESHPYFREDFQVFRPSIAVALIALLALSACANTLGGMAKDAKQTGQAIDSGGKQVLKAGAKNNRAAN